MPNGYDDVDSWTHSKEVNVAYWRGKLAGLQLAREELERHTSGESKAAEWPKNAKQIEDAFYDGTANPGAQYVPADLARELYEAAKSYPRDKRLSDALARYEREVGDG